MVNLFVAIFSFFLLLPTSIAITKIELTESNHLLLRGDVNDLSVSKVIQGITTSKDKKILLFIDSSGGSVTAGYKLMKIIETSGKEVTCVASNAASMAFAILQSCQKRLVLEDSLIMQHVMSYSIEGQEPKNYQFAQLIHRINVLMDKKQAERIGISYEAFREKVRDDWWLFGEEAVKSNAADEMVEVSCSEELSKKTYDETVSGSLTTITVTRSGCPIAPGPVDVKMVKNSPMISDQQAAQELKEILSRVVSMSFFESRLRSKK